MTIVCTGRPVDEAGQAHGEPCGRVYHPRAGRTFGCELCQLRDRGMPGDAQLWAGHVRQMVTHARAAGWAILTDGDVVVDAMCPRCARPDPELQKLLRELERQ